MMKTALLTLGLMLALVAPALAQGPGCLSGGPGAVKVDAFPVSVTLGGGTTSFSSFNDDAPALDGPSGGGSMKSAPTKAGGCQVQVDIAVWNIQGRPAISMSNGTVTCLGDPSVLANTSAADLFAMLTRAAINEAIARGSIACTPDCGASLIQVIQPACVRRERTPDGMVFKTCDVYACCIKTYMVCCPDGGAAPMITEVESKSSGCGASGCESTCQ